MNMGGVPAVYKKGIKISCENYNAVQDGRTEVLYEKI